MKPDNPPAFPYVVQEKRAGSATIYQNVTPGMTLRDYFAGQMAPTVMAAILAGQLAEGGSHDSSAIVADISYGIADAMLKARKES